MTKLLDGGNFFEGIRWHEGNWYVSDLYSHRVLKVTPEGKAETIARVDQQPSGLGWMPDGSMLIVSMKNHRLLRRLPDGSIREHADLTNYVGGYANDMVVDHAGRAYVSNLGFDLFGGASPAATGIVRVDPNGAVSIVAKDLLFPNGMVITADRKTLIVAETFGARMAAFTISEDGALHDRRVWARMGEAPSWESVATMIKVDFAPDGCALDADGNVWVADALNGRACRIAPGGEILDTVRAPNGWGLYSCALGGPEGKTLLTCVAPDFDHVKRAAASEACLYAFQVDVPAARPGK